MTQRGVFAGTSVVSSLVMWATIRQVPCSSEAPFLASWPSPRAPVSSISATAQPVMTMRMIYLRFKGGMHGPCHVPRQAQDNIYRRAVPSIPALGRLLAREAMPIVRHCPSCLRRLRIADPLIGRHVRCPRCRSTFFGAGESATATLAILDRLERRLKTENADLQRREQET